MTRSGEVAFQDLQVNGVRLHVAVAGPTSGPLVVLLHGFPEFWYAWRHQLPPLARAGYRVVAPDMRGYDLSDKPVGVEGYKLDLLASDVAELVRAQGRERAVVVGHDWGGVVAWQVAASFPNVVAKLVILNAPHPKAFRRELARNPRQRRKSRYVALFQLPFLPEFLIRRMLPNVAEFFRGTSTRPEGFTDEDAQRYREALSRPGALTAMINYYRALVRFRPVSAFPRIDVSTLLIWGEKDVALEPGNTEDLHKWVPNLRVVRLPMASHWVMSDEPVRVTNLLLDFLGAPASTASPAEASGDNEMLP
ncbi:alpha/beta fold hydrolase [Deinococcus yavapaiensis]|uniref:Pimeloyl-ACP methyl ester carboxylesterase n=1 Tax=Deinococcus yavapaiensis KR-236 TaxID=694435 RepID=A0A318SC18_9DEIO|nr:alpha/beta hydrolase [Deinococcus yavapaiensis]PYE54844.1 pimeloyl-ACP methyl ester carboxylesterase [Deinococcus yavapaiensis KR-236]